MAETILYREHVMAIEPFVHKKKGLSRFHVVKLSSVIVIAALFMLNSYSGIAGQGTGAATEEATSGTTDVLCPPGLTRRAAIEPVVPVSAELSAAEPLTKT